MSRTENSHETQPQPAAADSDQQPEFPQPATESDTQPLLASQPSDVRFASERLTPTWMSTQFQFGEPPLASTEPPSPVVKDTTADDSPEPEQQTGPEVEIDDILEQTSDGDESPAPEQQTGPEVESDDIPEQSLDGTSPRIDDILEQSLDGDDSPAPEQQTGPEVESDDIPEQSSDGTSPRIDDILEQSLDGTNPSNPVSESSPDDQQQQLLNKQDTMQSSTSNQSSKSIRSIRSQHSQIPVQKRKRSPSVYSVVSNPTDVTPDASNQTPEDAAGSMIAIPGEIPQTLDSLVTKAGRRLGAHSLSNSASSLTVPGPLGTQKSKNVSDKYRSSNGSVTINIGQAIPEGDEDGAKQGLCGGCFANCGAKAMMSTIVAIAVFCPILYVILKSAGAVGDGSTEE